MWTPAGRAELARESLPCASSLTDTEWALIAPLLPEPSRAGRPWRWPLRVILDGIQYVLRTGCLLLAAVSTADRHDSHGGVALLRASRRLWPFLAHCFADQAYQGERVGNATAITVEIVRPDKGQKGFAVQPRRWVIERTFGWIARCRRLARDYEATPSSALAFFVLAAAMILVRRLAQPL